MSYDNMDHAGWVQRQIDAVRGQSTKFTKVQFRRAEKRIGFEGAPSLLLPWQQQAFNVLGIVGGGIYNAPISWDRVEWNPYFILVIWHGDMATWDSDALSSLVFGCHTARIRCAVRGAGPGFFRIDMSPRVAEGRIEERHPSLPEAVAAWNARIAPGHPIQFKNRDAAQEGSP